MIKLTLTEKQQKLLSVLLDGKESIDFIVKKGNSKNTIKLDFGELTLDVDRLDNIDVNTKCKLDNKFIITIKEKIKSLSKKTTGKISSSNSPLASIIPLCNRK